MGRKGLCSWTIFPTEHLSWTLDDRNRINREYWRAAFQTRRTMNGSCSLCIVLIGSRILPYICSLPILWDRQHLPNYQMLEHHRLSKSKSWNSGVLNSSMFTVHSDKLRITTQLAMVQNKENTDVWTFRSVLLWNVSSSE